MRQIDWYRNMHKKYSDEYIAEIRARVIAQLEAERLVVPLARPLIDRLLHRDQWIRDAGCRSIWLLNLPCWTYDNFGDDSPGWYRAVLTHTEGDGWHIFWTRIEQ